MHSLHVIRQLTHATGKWLMDAIQRKPTVLHDRAVYSSCSSPPGFPPISETRSAFPGRELEAAAMLGTAADWGGCAATGLEYLVA